MRRPQIKLSPLAKNMIKDAERMKMNDIRDFHFNLKICNIEIFGFILADCGVDHIWM